MTAGPSHDADDLAHPPLPRRPARTRTPRRAGLPAARPSGRPNPHFVGRVAAAAAAYHRRPSVRLLCSGGGDREGANEAEALLEALVLARVPEDAIGLDRDATRTIDTIDYLATHHADEPPSS
ncbi:MAG: ElyC/SanA/YdcF family protein [Myxococcota bacterium]